MPQPTQRISDFFLFNTGGTIIKEYSTAILTSTLLAIGMPSGAVAHATLTGISQQSRGSGCGIACGFSDHASDVNRA